MTTILGKRLWLMAYGFGDQFIQYCNTLYNGLSVKVVVNGFFSEKINI
jgi:hypothetical protein